MTEENTITDANGISEFGTKVGRVTRFFNRKGYGFISDLSDGTDYFVHNSEVMCKEGIYRKLYPGEYVSYNLIEREGKNVCSCVRGIMGYPLLVENEEHTYRVYSKQEHNGWTQQPDPTNYHSGESDTDNKSDGGEGDGSAGSDTEEPKEVINKEAPEGIEVADFDGLNTNEEMS
jgi:cold shock CspA family protein